jgi:hypothetical protein
MTGCLETVLTLTIEQLNLLYYKAIEESIFSKDVTKSDIQLPKPKQVAIQFGRCFLNKEEKRVYVAR